MAKFEFVNVSESRRKNMRHIKSTDTECEVILRHALWQKGYRYRKNYKLLPGKPDICLTKYKIAVFCDSDYFHGRDWNIKLQNKVSRGNNSEYWVKKIQGNINRDNFTDAQLRGMGWTVLHFWTSEIMKDSEKCVSEIDDMVKAICERK